MANMVLGGHTFASNPSRMTVLVKDKLLAEVLTLESVAVFDWGRLWAGKPLTLEWDYMPATEFDTMEALQDTVGDMVFDPQDGKGKTYDVWIKSFDGQYFLSLTSNAGDFRSGVEMVLIVKEQN